jgi:hypothetical protein
MELCEADLLAFIDDSRLAGPAESTIKSYVAFLRQVHEGVRRSGVADNCRARIQGVAGDPLKVERVHGSRALKRYGRWIVEEYEIEDPFHRNQARIDSRFVAMA